MGVLGWILLAAGLLLGLFVLILSTGMFLPKAHFVSRSLKIKAPPDKIWQVISDFQNVPSWYPEVIRVQRLPDPQGREVWREVYKGGHAIKLETMELLPPRRLVRSVAEEKGGRFTGQREFDIAPAEAGCRIKITERGEVSHPLSRLIFRLFKDPALHLEKYLKALAAKFGEAAVVEVEAGPIRLIP
jgi:uncharacterized protein YndB with AHSA1/START domain